MSRFISFVIFCICFLGCKKNIREPESAKINAYNESPFSAKSKAGSVPASALYPDLQTVVPQQLQVVNAQQRDWLRFSNGIANTGQGTLQIRPEYPVGNSTDPQKAIQQLFDAQGAVVYEQEVSQFEFHPEHNHWHIDAVALFEVRKSSPTGPVVGGNSIKTTFCLIDWVKLDGNSNSRERVYFDCFGIQGISPGWVDQYNQAVEGQELDITGVPAGKYYLVSTANPDKNMLEATYTNNTAWVSFDLTRNHKGQAKIVITGNSPCTGGLCGYSANR